MAIGSITNAHVTYGDNAPTVAVPSGAVAGNVYALFWLNITHGATLTWPDGFTEVSDLAYEANSGADLRCALRVATGSESGSFTGSTTSWQSWRTICAVITGVSATPDDASGNGTYAYTSSASLTGASITTTGADRVILWAAATLLGGSAATPTLTPPAGLTTDTVVDFGNGATIALADGTQASAGSATYSGSMGFGGVADSRSGLTLTIALAQSGGGGITGSLSGTLSSLTGSAAATLPITGAMAVTLGAITAASSGGTDIEGLAAASLAPMTGASDAALSIAAQGAATLGDLTGAAEGVGVSIVAGSVSSTLDAITTTSAAQIQIQASTSGTLSPVTLASQATLAIAAQGAATFGGLTALCAATIADPASPAAPASNSRFIRNFAS